MKFRTMLLAATAMALPLALSATQAQAQPVNGLYVAGGLGMNFMGGQTHSANSGPFVMCDDYCATARVSGRWESQSHNPGFIGLGSIGWGFGNGLRAEVEGSYRENSVRGRSFSGSLNLGGTNYPMSGDSGESADYIRGRSSQYNVMVNAFYDFNNVSPMVVPYVGVGVGYSWQRFTRLRAAGSGYVNFGEGDADLDHDSSNTVGRFAYQAIAGAAFPIAAVPGLSFTAEYRFMGTAGSRNLNVRGDADADGCFSQIDGCDSNGRDYNRSRVSSVHNHAILIGARYEFNKAPAPAMPAAAAPVPAGRSFIVFFDWDRFNLTARARTVIAEAAKTAKSVAHTRVEVNGYADTSGSPGYNMPLSMKRAQTVAAELVRNGVAKNEIVIKAFGDTVLLVPTGPGVREPQNRRVEIIIK